MSSLEHKMKPLCCCDRLNTKEMYPLAQRRIGEREEHYTHLERRKVLVTETE